MEAVNARTAADESGHASTAAHVACEPNGLRCKLLGLYGGATLDHPPAGLVSQNKISLKSKKTDFGRIAACGGDRIAAAVKFT